MVSESGSDGPTDLPDDWEFDPNLSALNRSLEREVRQEAEEVESIVAESELRARTIADVIKEARNRNEAVAVGTERRIFGGRVVWAAGDFLTLQSEDFEVDVNISAVAYVRITEASGPRPTTTAADGAGTFEMRLLERQSPVDRVEVGYRDLNESAQGRITTVGQDHIVLSTEIKDQLIIPITSIAWVVRRKRQAR